MGDIGDGSMNALGAINALRTGNIVFDMMIAMLIPVIFRVLFNYMGEVSSMVAAGDLRLDMLCFWRGRMVERTIEHKATQNMYGGTTTDRDTRNNVLLKAIQLYLDHKKMKYGKSQVSLTAMTEQREMPWYCSDEEGDASERTPAGKLKKYQLAQKAANHTWTSLGVFGAQSADGNVAKGKDAGSSSQDGFPKGKSGLAVVGPAMVELRVDENEEDKGEKGEKTVSTMIYRFRSRSADAIDCFINEAYQWYLGELRKMEDNSRYLYEMQITGGDKDSTPGRTYKRYKLSDHKTFASLFFEEKGALLGILKHFEAKTGKYAISGYPHKLGLLLHGPPGTGKTSLIKALAQHTGRSIVNVPLARITTNQELMDIMFDQQFMVQGEEVPIKLGFKDVIFVMEDVDAASKIVHRRDGKTTSAVTRTEVIELTQPKSAWQILLESSNEECRSLVTKLMEMSPRLKEAALSSKTLRDMAKQLMAPKDIGLLVGDSYGDASEDKKRREEALEAMTNTNNEREIAGTYINQLAGSIKALLEAGSTPDDALADELLGTIAAARPLQSIIRTSSSVKRPGVETHSDDEEEDLGSGAMDAATMMATMMSAMDGGKTGDPPVLGPMASSALTSKKDNLNLSGLLNVLDGVVDTPERILIMTTNHPEQLDPALIRPGRIDKKILLGYMHHSQASSMIEHYFQCQLSSQQQERLRAAIAGSDENGTPAMNLTPAQIEQLAAEHDAVDDMIGSLEGKGSSHALATAPTKELEGAQSKPSGRPILARAASTTVRFDH